MTINDIKVFITSIFGIFFLFATQTSAEPININTGKFLYNAACKTCHEPAKAKSIKAPAAFDVEAWKARFNNAKHQVNNKFKFKNINDYFLYQVKLGKGLMHQGGLCEESKNNNPNLNCSDQAYLAAIKYMSTKQLKN